MNTYIIKQQDGQSFQIQAEKLTIDCLSHEYDSLTGHHVFVIDEPLANITFTGKREAKP